MDVPTPDQAQEKPPPQESHHRKERQEGCSDEKEAEAYSDWGVALPCYQLGAKQLQKKPLREVPQTDQE